VFYIVPSAGDDKPSLSFCLPTALRFPLVRKSNQKGTLKNYVLKNLLVADAYQSGGTQEKTKSLTYIFMLNCRFNSLRRLLERISCEFICANLNPKPHEAEN